MSRSWVLMAVAWILAFGGPPTSASRQDCEVPDDASAVRLLELQKMCPARRLKIEAMFQERGEAGIASLLDAHQLRPDLRREIVRTIARLGGVGSDALKRLGSEGLYTLAQQGPPNDEVVAALRGLGRPALGALFVMLHDPDRNVRIFAASSLGRLGPEALDGLLEAMESNPDPEVRSICLQAAAQLDPQAALPGLLRSRSWRRSHSDRAEGCCNGSSRFTLSKTASLLPDRALAPPGETETEGDEMITLRPAGERGRTDWGWLDSRHTFSFGNYHDPQHMGFRALRVINDDRVAPGGGFGTHGHRDMEILSYVLEGALEHADSMGNGSVIRPGEIQFMRAGTGVTHSEYNHSKTEPVHFLQIWVVPAQQGLEPAYDQHSVDVDEARERWVTLATGDAGTGVIHLAQDVRLKMTWLPGDETRTLELDPGRQAWVHVARGETSLNESRLAEGDGVAVRDESQLVFEGGDAELLAFDLAPR